MNAVVKRAPVEATSPLLRASGLTVRFGAIPALFNVDLTIDSGELVVLTGEPGAGKTTLVRCIAGDITPTAGEIRLGDTPVLPALGGADRQGIAVVWQDLALCENLDVAGNVLLGQETSRRMFSNTRLHVAAGALLASLRIPIRDTTRLVSTLSGGQRQLLAIARAISRRPRILVLDEPTASLGVAEAAQVEELLTTLRAQGTAILLISRDIKQTFRLADRIVVLRHGRALAELNPETTHPDDLAALLSGQQIDSTARRQLTRLQGLADRLVSADPSSSLSLILSALGSALGSEKVCIHVVNGRSLVCTASLGFTPEQLADWSRLPIGPPGGAVGRAAAGEARVVEDDLGSGVAWRLRGGQPDGPTISTSWSVPVMGPAGVSAVISVFRGEPGSPQRDELDLLTLYSGYVASAVERDRLLEQLTARNRVLETIREMLQTLAGPVVVAEGLASALQSLRRGLQAEEVGLLTHERGTSVCRAYAGALGIDPDTMSDTLWTASHQVLAEARRNQSRGAVGFGRAVGLGRRILGVPFMAPAGATVLLASWLEPRVTDVEAALIEDAAHSLNLALEREEAGLAHQEAAALRRSRELQRAFLSRLSHELRTPLTAIRGYASSLLQPDVTWDRSSQERFLGRIAAESARLGRLVDDLLDFSAMESGVMRLQRDWCDVRLVVEAAVSCLPSDWSRAVAVACDEAIPPIWADHDRLEQVFVNLLTNAFRHNVPGTRVTVSARAVDRFASSLAAADSPVAPAQVEIMVIDDGHGLPSDLLAAPVEFARRHRTRSSGAGLGLSIACGIVEAHAGRVELAQVPVGTAFRIRLPVEATGSPDAGAEQHEFAEAEEMADLSGGAGAVRPSSGPVLDA